MTGTWINIITVLLGGSLGLLFGQRLPERFRSIVFQAIGLFTLFLGVSMALQIPDPLVLVLSLVIGGLLGEWMKLEQGSVRWSEKLKVLLKSKHQNFSEGMLTAFLLFCMGSMTILGALEEGLGGKPELLITKSIMDGFSAIILAAGLGFGVLFSVIPLLIYQGGLTLLASHIEGWMQEGMIATLTATGGVILIGLGINILEIKKIRVLNLIPALLIGIILSWLFTKYPLWNG